VACRQVIFSDFNADGRPDMFIACAGWDAPPFPGEQNQLFLSRPAGGWQDATATLPQIADFPTRPRLATSAGAVSSGARDGEPNVRELEPDSPMAQAA
jgi:hypothetical protein